MILVDNQSKIPWILNRAILSGNNILLNPGSSAETFLEVSEEIQIVLAGRKITGSGIFQISLLDKEQKVIFNEKIIFSSTLNNQKILKIPSGLRIYKMILSKDMAQFGRIELLRIQVKKVAKGVLAISNREKIYQEKFFIDSNKKQNIAIIVPYGIFGGAEVYLRSIFQEIPPNYNAQFFFLKRNNLSNYLVADNIKIEYIQTLQGLQTRILGSNFDDIIYYNSLNIYNFLINLKNKFNLNSKLIEIYHSDFKWSDSLSSLDHRQNIDLIIKITNNLCGKLYNTKQRVVPIPIDINKFSRTSQSIVAGKRLKFGMIARLSPEKDPLYALDLFRDLPCDLVIAGDGPMKTQIEAKINSEGIKNVTLLGHIDNVFEVYNDIDCFILTSNYEGVPISILEAMSMGLNIFTTDVGEIRSHLGNQDGIYYLTKNKEKDRELINSCFVKYNKNLREFILKNHSFKVAARKFFDSLYSSVEWNYYNENISNILIGEYI